MFEAWKYAQAILSFVYTSYPVIKATWCMGGLTAVKNERVGNSSTEERWLSTTLWVPCFSMVSKYDNAHNNVHWKWELKNNFS